jgi:hypothetical protein
MRDQNSSANKRLGGKKVSSHADTAKDVLHCNPMEPILTALSA